MSGHILKNYDSDLGQLKDSVLEMGSAALVAVEKGMKGLTEGDRELCSDVIDEDEIIDATEKKIDEQGMSILLRFNPVASDLRLVLSSINICRGLERIGDHAVNVAKRSRKILKQGSVDEVRLLEPLFSEAQKIVSAALTAYSDVDEEAAIRVIAMDSKVDKIHNSLSKALSSKIAEGGQSHTESLLNILFISRSLERIGDLAVNIAEDIVFITSAEDIRHS
ncbi:phosphate signaling complex protein PhoU [Akkermansiaceae bacterium]|nr:phosphate signaling complex protein PhoU [Akkermansiaceae bacterium]MDB4296030.1 phosphate signaling complex protein PhoU [bacterium]MDA7877025.1 phosphate signaling complex protein PhoU [Akkermansiaceae bacterium]MDB4374732.1 phosphate signaling complex protein PhoU [bacterium]MDB4433789.1 phosphate signaling complex protein PhoU [Akkermansiaceae bacterium]